MGRSVLVRRGLRNCGAGRPTSGLHDRKPIAHFRFSREAVLAFHGALAYHGEYPDVHYHLAKTLDELDRPAEAEDHWRTFIELAPDSPWAAEARMRMNEVALSEEEDAEIRSADDAISR